MPQVIDSEEYDIAGVYTIIHTVSARTYVGEAFNIRTRWKGHFNRLVDNSHENRFLQRAWNKYGPEAFVFKVFEVVENTKNLNRFLFKKKLKRHENEALKLFPKNFNLERPSEFGYLIPGPRAKLMMKKAALKERGTDQGRARMRRVRLDAINNPISAERHKKATKMAWQDPNIKASRIAAFNTPEGKKNREEAAARGWLKRKEKLQSDPEFLRKHKESRQKAGKVISITYSSNEQKERLSKQSSKNWKNPDTKTKLISTLQKIWGNPEKQKEHSETMRNYFKKKKLTSSQEDPST